MCLDKIPTQVDITLIDIKFGFKCKITNWRLVSPFVGRISHQINEKSLVDFLKRRLSRYG